MSIATMNWALSQRLETHQQQILLYVIADSADPSGVTRHCDPDYMVDRARLSRATMFRRLGELEELGVLSRRKYYTEEGAPRYEIRLNLEARIDLPIRSRRAGEDDGGGEHEAEAADNPKSQGETLGEAQSHSRETGAVSPVRPAQSHSCDSVSPPLSEGLPPNPPPGGSRSRKEVEVSEERDGLWRAFLGVYPGISAMPQDDARDALDALPVDDAEWAISSAPHYAAECRKLSKAPKNAHTWLKKAMFKNFPRGGPPAPRPDTFAADSPEGRAIVALYQIARTPVPERAGRVTFRGEISLPLLRLGEAAPRSVWPFREAPDQIAAWAKFVAAHVPGPRGSMVDTKGIGKDMRRGIYAPWPFPPSKDGIIYRDDTNDQQQEGSGDDGNGTAA